MTFVTFSNNLFSFQKFTCSNSRYPKHSNFMTLNIFETHSKTTALIIAVQQQHYKSICQNLGLVGLRDEQGMTALMYSAKGNNLESAILLANDEASLQDNQGNTALIHAVRSNSIDVVRLLAPFESNICNNNGDTALQVAKQYICDLKIQEILNKFDEERPSLEILFKSLE